MLDVHPNEVVPDGGWMSQRIRRASRDQTGFTLIELLVVIIVLGILAAVVVFAVRGAGDKGKEKACRSDTRALETALESYYARNNAYVASDVTPNSPPSSPWNGSGSPPAGYDPSGAHETALVTAGFLSESSRYHYVSNIVAGSATSPASYTIRVQDPACGTVNGTVSVTSGTNF